MFIISIFCCENIASISFDQMVFAIMFISIFCCENIACISFEQMVFTIMFISSIFCFENNVSISFTMMYLDLTDELSFLFVVYFWFALNLDKIRGHMVDGLDAIYEQVKR